MDATQLNSPSELRKALGLVTGTKRKPGRPAKPKVPLPGTEEPSTSPIFVTGTGLAEILEKSLLLLPSANGTTLSSVPSTVWEVTPIGFVENGSPRITDEQWGSLPADWRERLVQLGADRSEDPRDTIGIIAEYYSDSDLADVDLVECIGFYLINELI